MRDSQVGTSTGMGLTAKSGQAWAKSSQGATNSHTKSRPTAWLIGDP